MPIGAAEVQVGLLSLVEQPECDQFRSDAPGRGDQHGRRRQIDGLPQPHRAHPEDEQGHDRELQAVE